MTDELDIPQALKRPQPEEAEQEISLEQILSTIKELAEKRDQITATISGLKKKAQHMVGKL